MKTLRLGIVGSTRGTVMLPIIAAIKQNILNATIEIVVSNKADAMILTRATAQGLKAQFLDPTGLSRDVFDEHLSDILHEHKVDLVVLIGYMRILSNAFVTEWRNKVINVHPSLLPAFAGGMDANVHQAVLDSGLTMTGCTVHCVTEDVDQGAILVQKQCAVLPHDTVESLKARVQELEGEALIEAIKLLSSTERQNT